MTAEENKKADEAAKAKADKEAKEKADLEAKEKADKEAEEKKKADEAAKVEKLLKGNFIMTVSKLNWGANQKNLFYADKKPLINAKVMGKYADTLLIWLENSWITKGSY